MNKNQKIYIVLLLANFLLWGAFAVTLYNFCSLALAGAIIETSTYFLIGGVFAVSGVFSFFTAKIFQKLGV
jgi:hypothetical protein